jgi:hypothetical protein
VAAVGGSITLGLSTRSTDKDKLERFLNNLMA